ncbi:MAG: outer membrane protein assembly factor BamB family protein [Bacteroidales bacterium]
MDLENKLKAAHRAALISGIFCGVVALLLLLNFWQMKLHEPLESAAVEALISRLADDPNNETLKKEIRDFDLLARKAYFTSQWQVKTGTYLLLIGGIVLAVSLKIYTDLRARIEKPEEITEEILKARANAQYYLFLTGGLVLGLSIVAAVLTNDFLKDYRSGDFSQQAVPTGSDVEVIDVFPASPGASDTSATVTDTLTGNQQLTEAQGADGAQTESRGSGQPIQAANTTAASFSKELMKTNQATFRGFMGHGIFYSKNIPTSWNGASGENIKWKVATSKPGVNSPVIWGDKIFISGGDETARVVACYNRNTGQLLWEKEVTGIPGSPASPPRVSSDTGLAAPTMAVDGRRVYAIFATGDVIAFDLNGNKLWGRNLGVPNNHYGHSSSLQVWEDKLVVQYDSNAKGRMLALNTATGETIWDVDRPVHISWSSPILIEVNGKIQIVTTADPYIMGQDLDTGAELWKVEALMGEVGPSAASWDGLVFGTNEYARTVAVKPEPGSSFVWETDEYMSEASSPVAYEGLLFLATTYGVLVCYDARTGEKIWEKEFDDGFYSSPVIADGKIFMADMGGVTHILKADRSGTVLSEPALGDEVVTIPAFADGAVYLRGMGSLYCIGQ